MAIRLCVLAVTVPYSGATLVRIHSSPSSASAAVNFIFPHPTVICGPLAFSVHLSEFLLKCVPSFQPVTIISSFEAQVTPNSSLYSWANTKKYSAR